MLRSSSRMTDSPGRNAISPRGACAAVIAWWPGTIKAGSVSEHISGFQDFMPTAAELAGASMAEACDGISFVPTLLGKNGSQQQHSYLFWNFTEQGGKRSVLQWPWKLIHLNTGMMDDGTKKKAVDDRALKAKPLGGAIVQPGCRSCRTKKCNGGEPSRSAASRKADAGGVALLIGENTAAFSPPTRVLYHLAVQPHSSVSATCRQSCSVLR